jgi:hypothetical protein
MSPLHIKEQLDTEHDDNAPLPGLAMHELVEVELHMCSA